MPARVCSDCGVELTIRNLFITNPNLCPRCARGDSPKQWKAYFEKKRTTEQDVTGYPLSATLGRMIIFAGIALVIMTMTTLAGYGKGGNVGALFGLLVGAVLIRLVMRWRHGRLGARPFDHKRMWQFTLGFLPVLALGYFCVMAAFAPPEILGVASGLARYVVHVGPLEVRAITAILVGWLVVALMGFLVGVAVTAMLDKKSKSEVLAHYRAWEQTQGRS